MTLTTDCIEKFLHDGWVIVDIPDTSVVQRYAARLQTKAQELTQSRCTLANLHDYVDEAAFKAFHLKLADCFWEDDFSLLAAPAFLPILKELIGLDVMVQSMPYLRLARPHMPKDNIGFHKDTQYGQTPYELAVHIPFVDLDDDAALRVISGSHLHAEKEYPSESIPDAEVVKGSAEHTLGKPYAPRRLPVPQGAKTVPLSMHVGQAALFSPAIFHGQEVNTGTVTRVTTDMRFVNPLAYPDIRTGKKFNSYVPVSHSPIQQLAEKYFTAQ